MLWRRAVSIEIFSTSVFRQSHTDPVLTLFIARMNVAHERRQVTSDGSRGSTVSGDHATVGRQSLGTTPPLVDSLWGPRRRGSKVSRDHAAVGRQSMGTTPPWVDSLWVPCRRGSTVSRDHAAVGRQSLGTTPPWVDSLWGPRRGRRS